MPMGSIRYRVVDGFDGSDPLRLRARDVVAAADHRNGRVTVRVDASAVEEEGRGYILRSAEGLRSASIAEEILPDGDLRLLFHPLNNAVLERRIGYRGDLLDRYRLILPSGRNAWLQADELDYRRYLRDEAREGGLTLFTLHIDDGDIAEIRRHLEEADAPSVSAADEPGAEGIREDLGPEPFVATTGDELVVDGLSFRLIAFLEGEELVVRLRLQSRRPESIEVAPPAVIDEDGSRLAFQGEDERIDVGLNDRIERRYVYDAPRGERLGVDFSTSVISSEGIPILPRPLPVRRVDFPQRDRQ